MIFTTQWNFDYKNSDKHAHSDEIITIPDDSFTIQELMQRAVANTLPALSDYGKYGDNFDIDIDDDMEFINPVDLTDLYTLREQVDKQIHKVKSDIFAEREQPKVNLAPEKKSSEVPQSNDN